MDNTLKQLGITRGLIIRQPHIGRILDGLKTWEMRSSKTNIRGEIALIEGGSGMIVGTARLERVQPAPTRLRSRHMTRCFHRIEEADFSVMDKWCWAWVLSNVCKFDEPIPYEHPQGAVIWVKLS